jgi:hypothetical protein
MCPVDEAGDAHPMHVVAAEPRQTAVASGDLTEFVAANKMPPTIEFNDGNSQKIFNAGIPHQVPTACGDLP